MRPRLARRISEALASVLCLAFVLGTLVAVDERVRTQLTQELSGNVVSSWTSRARSVAFIAFDAAHDQVNEHAAMAAFAAVALILLLFMLKS